MARNLRRRNNGDGWIAAGGCVLAGVIVLANLAWIALLGWGVYEGIQFLQRH